MKIQKETKTNTTTFQTNMLSQIISDRLHVGASNSHVYTPEFFRLNKENDRKKLEALLTENSSVVVYDTLMAQLKQLVRTAHPKKTLTTAETESLVLNHLKGTPIEEYGVWVYYPWSSKVVHILDENEFINLRSNRNKYKITEAESQLLAQKKVGVIGLSVGQSVSVTLAMERAFGELRIADFDDLEITNLNRLRSGIHNMGLLKTVLVAREIAEIDPFLKVVCFHEGITEKNIGQFLEQDGKLDVLIDECDSIDIKILSRIEAKKRQIPVLMEASDRATIDVERFDLEPNRPIIHGWLDHLEINFEVLKNLKTSEEKVPYMLPISGVETLSPRMKASALEVGESIVTWPQLASAVALGGGITADICRRILLDQFHQSGRYFVDIEELIGDPKETKTFVDEAATIAPLNRETSLALVAPFVKNDNNPISQNTAKQIVEAALLAPSAGNNQPWKWHFDGNSLWLLHDLHRSVSFGDFRSMASYVALGAAIENAALKADELGFQTEVIPFPNGGWKNPFAQLKFSKNTGKTPVSELVNFIQPRHTNRADGNGQSISQAVFDEMHALIDGLGARFIHLSQPDQLEKMANLIGTSERLRIFITEGHFELFQKELRWDNEQAVKSRDGLDLNTFELSIAEHIGLRLARDPQVVDYLHQWDAGTGLERLSRRSVKTSSAVGILTIPEFESERLLNAGRALERIWLLATKHGIAFQPMLAPILHFVRILKSENSQIKPDIETRFLKLYDDFVTTSGLARETELPVFLFRLGYANEPDVKSFRLPIEDVYYS